ncbi:cell division protein ZapA [Shimia sp. R11_0]|uniref:Cell division protein ZapA n=1 Tax=Shimia marina TaxID=321267 RepID=A0A0P1ESI4_9RHOB|nr:MULTISPECIES: cell division protein ZapA [Shimia]MBO9476845.1 cell division protein ZapA [Shimia sp. R11_0]CUH53510.1 Cell division protein ZapA [Shimia marina]SFD75409.1 cell division protein ZapA [Shimia marina]
MPEVQIEIGGRVFEVACQDGEQHFLRAAAQMLDDQAKVLIAQAGRIPEARMLLMAGLMLADKTAGLEDQLRDAQAKIATREAEIKELRDAPLPEPEKIEVPTIPETVTQTLAEMAARAESLADLVEEKAAG